MYPNVMKSGIIQNWIVVIALSTTMYGKVAIYMYQGPVGIDPSNLILAVVVSV